MSTSRFSSARFLTAPWLAMVALVMSIAAGAAGPVPELHGHSDGFIGPGVAIAWAILRGPTESETKVVLRIEVEHMKYESVAIDGIDPFGGARTQRLPRTPLATPTDVQIPRSQFADAPRTELRFYPPKANEPVLVVYYAGVPDTVPEFNDAKKMDAFLGPRIGELFRQALKQ